MKLKVICFLIILFSSYSSLNVHADYYYYPTGSAVYREGGDLNAYDHGGIMKNGYWVYEIAGYPLTADDDTVQEYSITSFKNVAGTFYGTFAPKNLSHSKRQNIVTTAEALDNDPEIDYTAFGQIDTDLYNLENYIQVHEITDIRCDGVIEFAYEANDVPVWGATNTLTSSGTPLYYWNITDLYNGTGYHKTLPAKDTPWKNVAPVIQRGAASVNNPLSYTTFRYQSGWDKNPDTGDWYYLDSSNLSLYKGWLNLGGAYYYLDPVSGIMKIGWLLYQGEWYYLDSSGAMKTGWLLYNSKWYYLNFTSPIGHMSNDGWQWIDGKCYYFYSDGSMAANTIIDGYKVGADGAWIQ